MVQSKGRRFDRSVEFVFQSRDRTKLPTHEDQIRKRVLARFCVDLVQNLLALHVLPIADHRTAGKSLRVGPDRVSKATDAVMHVVEVLNVLYWQVSRMPFLPRGSAMANPSWTSGIPGRSRPGSSGAADPGILQAARFTRSGGGTARSRRRAWRRRSGPSATVAARSCRSCRPGERLHGRPRRYSARG